MGFMKGLGSMIGKAVKGAGELGSEFKEGYKEATGKDVPTVKDLAGKAKDKGTKVLDGVKKAGSDFKDGFKGK